MFLSIREPMFVPFLECMFFSGSTNLEHQPARLMGVIPELKSCTIMKYFPLEILGSVLWGLNFSLWLKKKKKKKNNRNCPVQFLYTCILVKLWKKDQVLCKQSGCWSLWPLIFYLQPFCLGLENWFSKISLITLQA